MNIITLLILHLQLLIVHVVDVTTAPSLCSNLLSSNVSAGPTDSTMPVTTENVTRNMDHIVHFKFLVVLNRYYVSTYVDTRYLASCILIFYPHLPILESHFTLL